MRRWFSLTLPSIQLTIRTVSWGAETGKLGPTGPKSKKRSTREVGAHRFAGCPDRRCWGVETEVRTRLDTTRHPAVRAKPSAAGPAGHALQTTHRRHIPMNAQKAGRLALMTV